MSLIKTVLLSSIPLPYVGIGSWTIMMNYHLKKKNHIDYIICPKSIEETDLYTYYTVKDKSVITTIKDRIYKSRKFSSYINHLNKILKQEEKVIVQIIDNSGLLYEVVNFLSDNNLTNRVYLQYFYHGFEPFTKNEYIYEKIDELILLSHASYKAFKNDCYSLPVKVTVNHNGIDEDKFYPIVEQIDKNKLRNKYGVSNEKLLFVWCSKDKKKKGLELILQVWNQLLKRTKEDIELIVIGNTNEIETNKVRFLGKMPNSDLAAYYQMSDFYLFPTLWKEGFGLSLVEALKTGLYCIASDFGAVREVLNDGNYGKLIEEPNVVDNWVNEIESSIMEFKNNDNKNPYLHNLPQGIYSIETWHNNNNRIIELAKENFRFKYYL